MKEFVHKVFFCEDWKLKGHPKDCEFCLGMKLEKELATAKAENGRLVEALKFLTSQILTNNFVDALGHKAENLQAMKQADDALSNSNALDYWQGEIRRAKEKRDALWQERLLDVLPKDHVYEGDDSGCPIDYGVGAVQYSLSRLQDEITDYQNLCCGDNLHADCPELKEVLAGEIRESEK